MLKTTKNRFTPRRRRSKLRVTFWEVLLAPDFVELFKAKLSELQAIYNPVNVNRLMPFLFSHINPKTVEEMLRRLVAEGIIKVSILDIEKGGLTDQIRTVALVEPGCPVCGHAS